MGRALVNKVNKAQVGRLVKKAIGTIGKDVEKKASNKTLATWRDATGKVYKRETEKSLERDALKKYKAETAPKNKMEAKIDAREKKIKKDNDSYDQSVWESYQKNGGKTKSMKMGGKIKKAQKGITYKNLKMGVKNEQYQMTGQNKDVTPSSKDSARYRGGFEQGMKGMKGMKNEGQVEKMGRWEGQNAGKKKGKMGMTVKKAQDGVKTLRGVNPPSPSGLTFGKKAGARKTAKAKSEYESSSNPKVEYNIGKQRIPGGIRGGQNVSMDTTGMAAGKKRFPVKVKMRSGKDVYYETNRSQAKGAVRVSKQKMGGKISKTSKKK